MGKTNFRKVKFVSAGLKQTRNPNLMHRSLPGAARSRQEHPGAARCVDGRMGVRKGWQQGMKNDVENREKMTGTFVNCMHFCLFIFHMVFPDVFPHRVSYRVSRAPETKCEKTFLAQI